MEKKNVMLWFGRPRGIPNAVSNKEYQNEFFYVGKPKKQNIRNYPALVDN